MKIPTQNTTIYPQKICKDKPQNMQDIKTDTCTKAQSKPYSKKEKKLRNELA